MVLIMFVNEVSYSAD